VTKKRRTTKRTKPKSLLYRGVTYASDFEITIRKALDRIYKLFKRRKGSEDNFDFEYETEVFPYVLEKSYTPDWPIRRPDGTTIYVESKGNFDRDARAKMLAVKEQHPDKEFVLLFQRDNYLYRGAKSRYSNWAARHGFDYAVGCIPLRWLLGSKCPKNKLEEVYPINVDERP
jgi:hypothetical protein